MDGTVLTDRQFRISTLYTPRIRAVPVLISCTVFGRIFKITVLNQLRIKSTIGSIIDILKENTFDIILLDVIMPEQDGFDLLSELRRRRIYTPVILLSGKTEDAAQVEGLGLGADDYITKPFSMLILGKRITALLRRSQNKPAINTVKLGDITVDFSGYTASDENGKIDITPKELEILKV